MYNVKQSLMKTGGQKVINISYLGLRLMAGLAIVAILILSGCIEYWSSSGPQISEGENIEISGVVHHAGPFVHPPLQGAIVRIAGSLGPVDTTDEQGNYSISHYYGSDRLPIEVERDGYQTYTDTIPINLEDSNHYTRIKKDIFLKKTSTGGD